VCILWVVTIQEQIGEANDRLVKLVTGRILPKD